MALAHSQRKQKTYWLAKTTLTFDGKSADQPDLFNVEYML